MVGGRASKDEDLTREPEMIRAYRDTWTLGVHSYLAYLKQRLLLACELLTDSGSRVPHRLVARELLAGSGSGDRRQWNNTRAHISQPRQRHRDRSPAIHRRVSWKKRAASRSDG